MGTLEAIWVRPAARAPLRAVDQARAVAGAGLEGDHARGGRRQVTILSRERWESACRELGKTIDPAVRRANLLIAGVPLDLRVGAVLRVGPVRVVVEGESRPCELLDDGGRLGLCAALRADTRAGLFGRIADGGELQVGDRVVWEDAPASG